ncbi:MAG: DivIVA domain-containing protein, partial [Actinobacteria bacterium]|nr:DivIVA domain-containing protein [Actinomycetota bacterium]
MALLTADDVLNKKFQATKFRDGYDQDEVDDFLDEVVTTLNELQTENDELTNKLAAAERRIAELSRGGGADIVAEPVAISAPEPVFAPPVPATPEPVVAPVAASEPESATGMLALAQKLHDDYVRSGQTEGERVVSEARSRADQIVHEA